MISLILLFLAACGGAVALAMMKKYTGETPGGGGSCGGIPNGGTEFLHENIYTTAFGGCGSNVYADGDPKGCAEGRDKNGKEIDNCKGSGNIFTGCSAPTKMYAALPLGTVAAQCSGDINKCAHIQVINPKNNKSLILAVVDTGPWNTDDKAYVLGTSKPQAEGGTDKRGRTTNKAGLDISPEAKKTLDGETFNWKFTTLPLSDNSTSGCTSGGAVGGNGQVVLDPGHGADDCDRGFIGEGTECGNNFLIATKVKALLEAKGIKVVMTKATEAANPSLPERAKIANSSGASVFVSIHSNSDGGSGPLGIIPCPNFAVPNNNSPDYQSDNNCAPSMILSNSKKISHLLVDNIASKFGFSSKGYIGAGELGVFTNMQIPAALIEMFFMDNPSDIAKYKGHEDDMAQVIASSILTYLGK